MKRNPILAPALALFALFAAPAAAQENSIHCMDQSFSASERQQIAELASGARIDGQGNASADGLTTITIGKAIECGALHGWGEQQTMFAAYYELGRMMERGYRDSDQFTKAQLANIDATLDEGDRTALWNAVENVMVSGMTGEAAEQPSSYDLMILGSFSQELDPSPDEGFDEKVGILLGFMSLQTDGAREFSALAK